MDNQRLLLLVIVAVFSISLFVHRLVRNIPPNIPPNNLPNNKGYKNNEDSLPVELHGKFMEAKLHELMTTRGYKCRRPLRLGRKGDGGWSACFDSVPTANCLVFSFGIRDDWSFDDDARLKHNCTVHSFDPFNGKRAHRRAPGHWFHSIGLSDGQYELHPPRPKFSTLMHLREMLNSTDVVIDVLKFDIEYYEWISIPNMILDGQLSSVRQILWEAHLFFSPDEHKMRQMMKVMNSLYEIGFRIFFTAPNAYRYTSRFVPKKSYWGFYNLGMINTKLNNVK